MVPARAYVREPVPVSLTVRNAGPDPIELFLFGRTPTLDVVVTSEDGETLWHKLDDEAIPAILQVYALRPMEQIEQWTVWHPRDEVTGRCTVTGKLLTEGEPIEATSVVTVTRR